MITKLILYGVNRNMVLEDRVCNIFFVIHSFSLVSHVLAILYTFVVEMIGKLEKNDSWLELGLWEFSKSTTVGKGNILLLSMMLLIGRRFKLVFGIVAIVFFEREVDWICM